MEEKFKCYVKVAFPKDTELKTKQILDFYYKHQHEILKKAKKLSKSCSTKNLGGNKTRSKSKSKSKSKFKSKTKSKTRSKSKKGGNILAEFFQVALITVGMMFAAAAFETFLTPAGREISGRQGERHRRNHNTPSDDDLEVETEQQYPRDQINHSRSRNRIVATPRNRIVATPRNRTPQSQQDTGSNLYNTRYHSDY